MNSDILIEVLSLILFVIVAPIWLPIDWWLQRRRRKKAQKLYDKAGGTYCHTSPFYTSLYDDLHELREAEYRHRMLIGDVHMARLGITAAQAAQQLEVLTEAMRGLITIPIHGELAKCWDKQKEKRRKQKEIDDFYQHEWRTS